MAMKHALLLVFLWLGIALASDKTPSDKPRGTIAFASQSPRGFDVYATNVNTATTARLTDHPMLDFNAAASPGGKRVALISERDGNMEIYSMNPDGSNQHRLTSDFALDDQPSWSPD